MYFSLKQNHQVSFYYSLLVIKVANTAVTEVPGGPVSGISKVQIVSSKYHYFENDEICKRHVETCQS